MRLNQSNNSPCLAIAAMVAIGMLTFVNSVCAQSTQSVPMGGTAGVSLTADGNLHQFYVDLHDPLAPALADQQTVHRNNNSSSYFQASDNRWYLAPVGWPASSMPPWQGLPASWNLTQGNTGHPDWGQWRPYTMGPEIFFNDFEISPYSPTVALVGLGYQLDVQGKRLKAGGTGPGGGAGEVADNEESWGSSIAGDSIDGFTPNFTLASAGVPLVTLGCAVTSIKGTISAGQHLNSDGTSIPIGFTYTVGVKGPGQNTYVNLPITANAPAAPILNGALANWDLTSLNADGTAKFLPGLYSVLLTVTAATGGASGQATASVDYEPLFISADGTSPVATTQAFCVGQQVVQTVEARPANANVTDFQWTIGGQAGAVVKNYTEAADASSANQTSVGPADTIANVLKFYWVTGGDGRQVSIKCKVNGVPYTATTTFNVQAPTMTAFAGTTGDVAVDHNAVGPNINGHWAIHFGNNDKAGIRYSGTANSPASYAGMFKVTQIIASHLQDVNANANTIAKQDIPEWWLDTEDPYGGDDTWTVTAGGTQPISDNDSPGQGLTISNTKFVVNDQHFQVYIMFKPAEGINPIWVPVSVLAWGWKGEADSEDGIVWSLHTGAMPTVVNPTGSATSNFPSWQAIAKGAIAGGAPEPPWTTGPLN